MQSSIRFWIYGKSQVILAMFLLLSRGFCECCTNSDQSKLSSEVTSQVQMLGYDDCFENIQGLTRQWLQSLVF